ncbi:glycosyltransferase family 4 protein [Arthrobacter sp. AD-310]
MGVPESRRGYDSIRIRPELRAAQVERAAYMTPALTLYFDEKYDLGESPLSSNFIKVNLVQALKVLVRRSGRVLEVPEPLWLRWLPKTVLLALVWKTVGIVLRQERVVVTYSIENNDLASLISPRRPLSRFVLRLIALCLGTLLRVTVDRIAFGSSAAERLYQSLPGVGSISTKLIEELPAAKDGRGNPASPGSSAHAVFLGELDNRKGIEHVMAAWSVVEEARPDAHITIAGNGRLASVVESWCAAKPDSRGYAGFVQHHQVPALLDSKAVLVAPSLREGRWREQIGLPIVEALAAGLTVVTTDETGLAQWLRSHGHTVIAEKDVASQLPQALLTTLNNPLNKTEVLDTLPSVAGRIASDAWLHSSN